MFVETYKAARISVQEGQETGFVRKPKALSTVLTDDELQGKDFSSQQHRFFMKNFASTVDKRCISLHYRVTKIHIQWGSREDREPAVIEIAGFAFLRQPVKLILHWSNAGTGGPCSSRTAYCRPAHDEKS